MGSREAGTAAMPQQIAPVAVEGVAVKVQQKGVRVTAAAHDNLSFCCEANNTHPHNV